MVVWKYNNLAAIILYQYQKREKKKKKKGEGILDKIVAYNVNLLACNYCWIGYLTIYENREKLKNCIHDIRNRNPQGVF
jgi:hypothetical protein